MVFICIVRELAFHFFAILLSTDWVEFSPYEIGMEKYGTFMQTEHFGSKFFCGKLVKSYEEPPLWYLQGKVEPLSVSHGLRRYPMDV